MVFFSRTVIHILITQTKTKQAAYAFWGTDVIVNSITTGTEDNCLQQQDSENLFLVAIISEDLLCAKHGPTGDVVLSLWMLTKNLPGQLPSWFSRGENKLREAQVSCIKGQSRPLKPGTPEVQHPTCPRTLTVSFRENGFVLSFFL